MTDTPAHLPPIARRRPLVVVGVIAGAAVLIAAGGVTAAVLTNRDAPAQSAAPASAPASSAAAPPAPAKTTAPVTYSATGSITLISGFSGASTCSGRGGFQDVTGGAELRVLDSVKTVVATGKLETGRVEKAGCVFLFALTGVPAGKGTYEVTLGQRPGHRYSENDFATQPLNMRLG